jgi:hypothetical protein
MRKKKVKMHQNLNNNDYPNCINLNMINNKKKIFKNNLDCNKH